MEGRIRITKPLFFCSYFFFKKIEKFFKKKNKLEKLFGGAAGLQPKSQPQPGPTTARPTRLGCNTNSAGHRTRLLARVGQIFFPFFFLNFFFKNFKFKKKS